MREHFRLCLVGPNRRSDRTVIEQLLEFEEAENRAWSDAMPGVAKRLNDLMTDMGIVTDEALLAAGQPTESNAGSFGWFLGRCAILLQRWAGHDVVFFAVLDREDRNQVHVVFEHEDVPVGEFAGSLALRMLCALVPELEAVPDALGDSRSLRELAAAFSEFSVDRALPADTQAIVEAAARLDVPCVKLEREPYDGLAGDFRIRMYSLLMLGHCAGQQIVDGTLCVTRSQAVLPLAKNRPELMRQLRAAGLVSGPVYAPGEPVHTIIVANHEMVGIVPSGTPDPGIALFATQLSRQLDVGLMTMKVQARDISQPLAQTGGAVIEIDPAPQLDRLLPPESEAMRAAAEGFVRWVFPSGSSSRVPVAAVTGTNGKTTTSRMIDHIMRASGYRTSLTCSDGLYLHGQLQAPDDSGQTDVCLKQFEYQDVDLVVQEMVFGRIARNGFPVYWYDVSVCTNVTTDHIGRLGVETVAQMADLKRSVLDRARYGAVLNADDPLCIAMIPQLGVRRLLLVSEHLSIDTLRGRHGAGHGYCVLEDVGGRETLVLYEPERTPLVAVGDVPATFGGTARFNVANALHAAAACHVLGASPEAIGSGLRGMAINLEIVPGRMNIYERLPFKVILDFAHNADGIRRVGDFLNRQGVEGRKIMLMAAAGERSELDIAEKGRAAAEYFDHFVVRSYPDRRGRGRQEMVDVMSRALLQAGVRESDITGIPDPDRAVDAILAMGRPGDWLVMNWGNGEAEKMWGVITSFEPGGR